MTDVSFWAFFHSNYWPILVYVERELGDGVFSNVYLVLDRQDNAKKAMKIIRNTQEYMAAAEEEIEVLNYFDEKDPQKKEQLVIRILETFQVEPIDRFGHVSLNKY